MSAQRYVSTSFWDDTWVQEELTPNERLLYLYFLTSPLTNIAGIYEIGTRRMSFDTGMSASEIVAAIDKFETNKKIRFVDNWLILINWPKHQVVKEESNVRKGIDRVLTDLPDNIFAEVVANEYQYEFLKELERFKEFEQDPCKTLASGLQDPRTTLLDLTSLDLTLLDSTTPNGECPTLSDDALELPSDDSKSKRGSIPYREIIDYLNFVCGTSFKATTKNSREHISARWTEGFRIDDFKSVVDKKFRDSKTMRNDGLPLFDPRYLRPQTLFGTKFEGYLNQPDRVPVQKKGNDLTDRLSGTLEALSKLEE